MVLTPKPARTRGRHRAALQYRSVLLACAVGLTLFAVASAPALAATFKVALVVQAEDPRLERGALERAALGHATGPAADAIKQALAEARPELESAGAKLELEVLEVADAAAARAVAARLEKAGATALLADLPAAWLLALAEGTQVPVLNLSSTEDNLRQLQCRRNLWHLVPSERMRADALAQFLVSRRWQNVLLLTGPSALDAERSATVQAAIKRYGLKLAAARPFKVSADPRERDLANPLLLTGVAAGSYDVVWVVDAEGEFAQGLPYRTALPRPVVGDGGLVPVAWSAKFDRYGAPQVTRRLTKAAGRPMGALDWPAWMGAKALVAAALANPKASPASAAFAKALASMELDGSKGSIMSFRPWDGQLRQPLLLGDGQSVIATAPVEGLLHPRNKLDTLGADEPEKLCKARG
jgi:ABC transporter substrate binding protein (PQQ-dependent alcohol dehydrogenase system)